MSASIRAKRTTYDVYGQLKDVAPILAWIADQAPSACVKFDGEGGSQRMSQWFEFEVWFEDDTDEVNFKMFQSEAFEEAQRDSVSFQISAAPGITFHAHPSLSGSLLLNKSGQITGYTRGRK
uniref:Uncharacterized protein n=1 Tax=viral metagenome TaxID=1070528 RepID=A0A6M3XKV9_9ZZZZ